jgi:hypothetical protein
MHRVSAQNKQAVANFFAAKVQISTSKSGLKYLCGQRSKMAFQDLDKQLQIFHFLCTNMASLSLFQDGVSGVHKITRYNDEGLKRRENSLISFPLEIIKRRRTAAIFSLNKDGGVFNGTMFDLVTKYICRTEYMRVISFPL